MCRDSMSWVRCSTHGVDFPSAEKCPLCVKSSRVEKRVLGGVNLKDLGKRVRVTIDDINWHGGKVRDVFLVAVITFEKEVNEK